MKWITTEPHTRNHLKCTCSCGVERIVYKYDIINGRSKNCGCTRKTAGGLSRKEPYRTWQSMMQRCYRETVENYPNYGGRGIKVCDRWHDFNNFYSDMYPKPEGKSLDRIDNDGDYEPSNCKWSTAKEQANNRRPRKTAIKSLSIGGLMATTKKTVAKKATKTKTKAKKTVKASAVKKTGKPILPSAATVPANLAV